LPNSPNPAYAQLPRQQEFGDLNLSPKPPKLTNLSAKRSGRVGYILADFRTSNFS